MRITENSLYSNTLFDLQNNEQTLLNQQAQLSSGKTINKASDNPAGTIDVLRLKEILADSNVQKSNIEDGSTWLDTSDAALSQLNDVVHRAHDLMIQAANGTYNVTEDQATAAEINQILQSVVSIANTQVDGHYIFGGTKTTIPPYVDNGNGTYTFQGSTGQVLREIAPGTNEAINTSLDSFLSGSTGLFNTLVTLKNNLNSGNTSNLSTLLSQINTNQTSLQTIQADVGARANRLTESGQNLDQAITNFTQLLSNVEDVDITKAYTSLNVDQNVYQSSLQTIAKIEQKSLIDYLG